MEVVYWDVVWTLVSLKSDREERGRGETDEASRSERGGNAGEAWHCTRDFCRHAAVSNNGWLAALQVQRW
jgi:hypothetical protein